MECNRRRSVADGDATRRRQRTWVHDLHGRLEHRARSHIAAGIELLLCVYCERFPHDGRHFASPYAAASIGWSCGHPQLVSVLLTRESIRFQMDGSMTKATILVVDDEDLIR